MAENRRSWDLQKVRIAQLQSQLIKLKVKRETDQEAQKTISVSVENKLTDLQETCTLGIAVRSVKPVGGGKKIVLAFSGILGLMGGVMLAFFPNLQLMHGGVWLPKIYKVYKLQSIEAARISGVQLRGLINAFDNRRHNCTSIWQCQLKREKAQENGVNNFKSSLL